MDPNKRKLAEGWLDQASTHLTTARERVKSYHTIAETVQSAQTCVELSVKAVLAFLDIDFPKSHGWGEKQMQALAEQVRSKKVIEKLTEHNHQWNVNLPRLLFLMNFWGEFYLLAKYGMEAGSLATPKELFQTDEAELAIRHAEECERAASHLRYLAPERAKALVK